jgi:threonine/homoserine/homoserine lactone efflux protein
MALGPSFDIAVALLCAVPGPTNALIVVAGAKRGARAVPALVDAAAIDRGGFAG